MFQSIDDERLIHISYVVILCTPPCSDDEDYENSNAWMNAAVVETDSGDNIDEWSDDELDEEYIAEDG